MKTFKVLLKAGKGALEKSIDVSDGATIVQALQKFLANNQDFILNDILDVQRSEEGKPLLDAVTYKVSKGALDKVEHQIGDTDSLFKSCGENQIIDLNELQCMVSDYGYNSQPLVDLLATEGVPVKQLVESGVSYLSIFA